MDSEVIKALQNQLNVERTNAQKYFYIASAMSNMAYDGFASFFTKQGQGELEHAKLIEDFLVSKRVQPHYDPLPSVSVAFDLRSMTREAALTETNTTSSLQSLYQLCDDLGEYQVCAFLVGLLVEQIEEETWSADLMNLVSRADENGQIVLDEIYGKK